MILLEKLRPSALIQVFRRWAVWVLAALGPACASPSSAKHLESAPTTPVSAPRVASKEPDASGDGRVDWARHTRAPVPAPFEGTGELGNLLPCSSDGALSVAARQLLDDPGWVHGDPLRPDFVRWAMRAAGSPYVRPQGARFSAASEPALQKAFARFAERLEPSQFCSVGLSKLRRTDGHHQLAVVIADAPASLSPLPTRAHRGEDLSFSAEFAEPTTRAELTVLSPSGQARSELMESGGLAVSTHFALYERGKHVVQLLADLPGGPEPVLEAWIFVDEDPEGPGTQPVPGASLATSTPDARRALVRMANAARRSAGLRPLEFDARLASLAQEHADAMRDARSMAHDLGAGGPVTRVEAAGLALQTAGENLARARSVLGAHRAIWESPAHRENLLGSHYDAIGIGVARDEAGVLWVCQLFADD